jgi:NAD(P)-dependent dehydrogenase (short-subunit alcohol dehydrogenase family)
MKNYLIIGASSGIGKSLAHMLTGDDNLVLGTYNTTQSNSDSVKYYQLNVMVEDPDLTFVPEVLDGLVYCPGSINLKPFTRIQPEDFVNDYRLQVLGAIKIIQRLIPNLKKANGSVVLFSTIAVQSGFSFHTRVSSSKGAIEGLTKALAAEFAPHIRFNCVAPSITQTPLAGKLLSSEEKIQANAQRHPLKRIGDPNDIASISAFLLSEESSWITGQVIHVDGGMSHLKV